MKSGIALSLQRVTGTPDEQNLRSNLLIRTCLFYLVRLKINFSATDEYRS